MRVKIVNPSSMTNRFDNFISVRHEIYNNRVADYLIKGTALYSPLYYYLNDEIYNWIQENKVVYTLGFFTLTPKKIHPDSFLVFRHRRYK